MFFQSYSACAIYNKVHKCWKSTSLIYLFQRTRNNSYRTSYSPSWSEIHLVLLFQLFVVETEVSDISIDIDVDEPSMVEPPEHIVGNPHRRISEQKRSHRKLVLVFVARISSRSGSRNDVIHRRTCLINLYVLEIMVVSREVSGDSVVPE